MTADSRTASAIEGGANSAPTAIGRAANNVAAHNLAAGTGASNSVSAPGPDAAKPEPKRRPKNRKSQIAVVAAEAFSERGYHAVGVDEIASVLGISGPALYRHFPNKYALFQHAVMEMVDGLLPASAPIEAADASGPAGPAAQIDHVLSSLLRLAIDNRRTGGLYRWEGRFLNDEDLAHVQRVMAELNQRILNPLALLRPDLDEAAARLQTATALSIAGSVTGHRAPLSAKRISPLLMSACWATLDVDLPVAVEPDVVTWAHPLPTTPEAETKRELLLREALRLFDQHGYHHVSIEQIANAAGITASGLYRSYSSKIDLLEAIFRLAATRLADAQTTVLTEDIDSAAKLDRLVEVYVDLSFQQSDLLSVYFAEVVNLPAPRRAALHSLQRKNVEIWSRLLWEARPELMLSEARYLVHAAFGLSLDLGRFTQFAPSATIRLRVRTLMLATLLGAKDRGPDA